MANESATPRVAAYATKRERAASAAQASKVSATTPYVCFVQMANAEYNRLEKDS